ncbi:uncharacterized protein BO97DRAFT_421932 [Aspergillus homomorphus CBS 101889]|uniref:Uncharacterized protein n=1 Tax=Aspergillus homomorphus (strain CBS 101889) TaxID=1450537 RepID=A0A395I4X7_ASPHC|nr:hypothetical protein BO97DRAFT_421932 [Aspergillus homomorphus CBS 101889]RAL15140.1 hypothetical protein BO97DRAFT_421932 [Aspergillus homomorphus CBS 101889]
MDDSPLRSKSLSPPTQLSSPQRDLVRQVLPDIEELRDYNNINRWLDDVQSALMQWDLLEYIDPTAPRPDHDDEDYEQWKQQAKLIFCWLYLHTSPTICEDPIFIRRRPRFPEDLIETVKDIVSRVDLEVSNYLWWSTFQMEPFNYRSFDEFFASYRDSAESAILVGAITPYQAFFILHQHLMNLEEVFEPPYSEYSDTIHSFGMADECPKNMTEETFRMFCEHVEELTRSADHTWQYMGKKRRLV